MKNNEVESREASPDPVLRANQRVRAVVIAAWIVSMLAGAMLIRWLLPHSDQYVSKQEPPANESTEQPKAP